MDVTVQTDSFSVRGASGHDIKLYALNLGGKYVPSTVHWSSFLHDNQRTGCFACGALKPPAKPQPTIKATPTSIAPGSTVLLTYTVPRGVGAAMLKLSCPRGVTAIDTIFSKNLCTTPLETPSLPKKTSVRVGNTATVARNINATITVYFRDDPKTAVSTSTRFRVSRASTSTTTPATASESATPVNLDEVEMLQLEP